jgi:hypothetical protein
VLLRGHPVARPAKVAEHATTTARRPNLPEHHEPDEQEDEQPRQHGDEDLHPVARLDAAHLFAAHQLHPLLLGLVLDRPVEHLELALGRALVRLPHTENLLPFDGEGLDLLILEQHLEFTDRDGVGLTHPLVEHDHDQQGHGQEHHPAHHPARGHAHVGTGGTLRIGRVGFLAVAFRHECGSWSL